MIIEIFEGLLALGLLVFFDLNVALLELLVLPIVLSRDLLVLLADNICLRATVLVLQCLLIVQLLFDLSMNGGAMNFTRQRYQHLSIEVVESISSLFEGHFCSVSGSFLQLQDFALQLSADIN